MGFDGAIEVGFFYGFLLYGFFLGDVAALFLVPVVLLFSLGLTMVKLDRQMDVDIDAAAWLSALALWCKRSPNSWLMKR